VRGETRPCNRLPEKTISVGRAAHQAKGIEPGRWSSVLELPTWLAWPPTTGKNCRIDVDVTVAELFNNPFASRES
jgi:hypothetical protein